MKGSVNPMKKLTVPPRVFHYQAQPVRTALIDGEAWFVAKDVCQVLGIANSRAALVSLDDDEKASVGIPDTSSSSRRSITVTALSEPGLYQLALRSRRPQAGEFRRWITHEVIPQLRRTGSYLLPAEGAATPGHRDLLQLAMAAGAECEKLRQENRRLRPKAEYYDEIANCSDSFSLGETAKLLKIPGFGRNHLIRFLRGEHILMTGNVATQRYINRGYFVVKQSTFVVNGELHVQAVTRVQEKGIAYIRRRLDAFVESFLACRS